MSRVLLLLLLAGPAGASDWTPADTTRQLVLTGLFALDWAQTREIIADPTRPELNPILGSDPSAAEVDVYFAVLAVGHYAIARALPEQYRRAWQYVWIGGQASTVAWNYQIGIRVGF